MAMRKSRKLHLVRLCAALALAGGTLPASAFDTIFHTGFEFPANHASPLGSNLDGVVDWSTSYDFVDVMKQSRGWITQNPGAGIWDTDDAACLDVDAHGNLRSLAPVTARPGCATASYTAVATLFFFGDLAGHYPSGRYTVTWDGSATISYHFAASRNAALSTPGRDVLDVNAASGGWMLRFDAIDPNDPPRNLHVWMPGWDEHTGPGQRFHPDFLALIARYRALRFMDWMQTNDSQQQEFADRPQPDDVRWTEGGGVPLEIMVELANRLDAEPWFTMPHRASDDYVTRFAQLAHRYLGTARRVHVEYSNEVWNGMFAQHDYAQEMGAATWGGTGTPYEQLLNWHGMRTAQVCDLWQAAWGSDAARVSCVLGAQAANAWTQTQAADCPLWTAGAPCSAHGIEAVAIAPYFGGYLGDPATQDTVAAWSLDTLFAELTSGGQIGGGPAGGALAVPRGWIDAHHAAATARGLRLVAYEGGQHLVGYYGAENNDALTALLTAANRDARMGTVYASHLADWRDHGGELYMHFTASGGYGKWGSWGAAEFIDGTAAPKHAALLDFIDHNACWWPGC